LVGHGPRTLGSAKPYAPKAPAQAPEIFTTTATGPIQADWPAQVSRWPKIQAQAPERRLFVVENAGLYDDDGAIYDLRTRRAFVETLDYWHIPASRHPALALRAALPARDLAGLSLFLGGLGGQTFYHFLVDHLPRLALFAPLLGEARRLIVQSHIEHNKLAWLREAGCTLPVEWLGPLDHLKCERLAFTGRINGLYGATPWTLASLASLFPPQAAPARRGRHLWAGRLGAHARAVSWEGTLIDRLPAPWEAVDFAVLSPAQVRATMAECAVFAGLHGAAFANLALAPAGLRVLEVFSAPNYAWYPAISTLRGHDHNVLFAANPEAVLSRLNTIAR
jgi:capsular polysaccharide biosynthesis protein